MKLWDKGVRVNDEIDRFTVGRDREMDLLLAPFDVLGTLAHITMLESIGLIESSELPLLRRELTAIYAQIEKGDFRIEEGIEDVHSQVELQLTRSLGDLGKKVHSGRSRNDQVLVDLKMYVRHEIEVIASLLHELAETFLKQSETYKDVLMPGYTHLQVAMPCSDGQGENRKGARVCPLFYGCHFFEVCHGCLSLFVPELCIYFAARRTYHRLEYYAP